MEILINIATLFVIGSVLGYFLEVLFRRFFSQKKWVNPGFMVGPYLPIYGFGTVILYAIWNIPSPLIDSLPLGWIIVIKTLFIGVLMTLLELITGLFFLNFFHIRLWDYSDRKLNFKGVICPLFSIIWMIIGTLFYYLLNSFFIDALNILNKNLIYSFFIGIGIGMMVVDACYSLRLGFKVKKTLEEIHSNYLNFVKKHKSSKLTSIQNLIVNKNADLKKFLINNKEKVISKFKKDKK